MSLLEVMWNAGEAECLLQALFPTDETVGQGNPLGVALCQLGGGATWSK